jgi:UDP-N-acetylmuramoylalanine--D-glutamate ligase
MPKFRDFVNGKKVTVLGLGLLGRGVGDAAFLAECGAEVTVTDKKSEEELASSVEVLKKYPHITFHLGGHEKEDFTYTDLVVKAAGVRLDSPEIAAARGAGVPVAMSTALFAKYAMEEGVRVVGVTGTRGKSTVSHMIYHAIKRAGRRTHLGGNVRGLSTLAMLPEVKKGDIAVLELDSWQLQGFGDLGISPHVAVFTNLMPDHQNYYRSMDEYFEDKANIFKYQKAGDTLVAGDGLKSRLFAAHTPSEPQIPDGLAPDWQLRVPGEHNRQNAALVAAALLALGCNVQEIRDGLESFEGVEGRLQFIGDVRGVKVYNDNNATTPEATIAALRALGEDITLIVGGSEKDLALGELISEIRGRVSRCIVLTHEKYEGSVRLMHEMDAAGVNHERADTLEGAVNEAFKNPSSMLLFSPAFASFGMFKNEYDRNDQFVRLIGQRAAA